MKKNLPYQQAGNHQASWIFIAHHFQKPISFHQKTAFPRAQALGAEKLMLVTKFSFQLGMPL